MQYPARLGFSFLVHALAFVLGICTRRRGLLLKPHVGNRSLTEGIECLSHCTEFIATVQCRDGDIRLAIGQPAHGSRHGDDRAGDGTPDQPDARGQRGDGAKKKCCDDEEIAFRNQLVLGQRFSPLRLISCADGCDLRFERPVGFRHVSFRLCFLQAAIGIELESSPINFQCIHDAAALRARTKGLLDQNGKGLRLCCMLLEIASISTQDEILLVSPHHQHTGANGYILDRLKAILD
ncbi:hypothetical protein D3C80_870820 [compost metagenome]